MWRRKSLLAGEADSCGGGRRLVSALMALELGRYLPSLPGRSPILSFIYKLDKEKP